MLLYEIYLYLVCEENNFYLEILKHLGTPCRIYVVNYCYNALEKKIKEKLILSAIA